MQHEGVLQVICIERCFFLPFWVSRKKKKNQTLIFQFFNFLIFQFFNFPIFQFFQKNLQQNLFKNKTWNGIINSNNNRDQA
jgi:hypothetical protein